MMMMMMVMTRYIGLLSINQSINQSINTFICIRRNTKEKKR